MMSFAIQWENRTLSLSLSSLAIAHIYCVILTYIWLYIYSVFVFSGAELLAVNADGNMPYDICEDDDTLDYIESEMAKRGQWASEEALEKICVLLGGKPSRIAWLWCFMVSNERAKLRRRIGQKLPLLFLAAWAQPYFVLYHYAFISSADCILPMRRDHLRFGPIAWHLIESADASFTVVKGFLRGWGQGTGLLNMGHQCFLGRKAEVTFPGDWKTLAQELSMNDAFCGLSC